jgi:hypothetical protein
MIEDNIYKCELVGYCPFFRDQMAEMPRSTRITMEIFCREEYEKCARHIVFEECGSENVPIDLFPSEFKRAEEIVSQCKE